MSTYQFPLKQGIGGPSVPVVAAGDRVLRGQMIAEKAAKGPGSSIHSSVTGTVKEVTETSIFIDPDAEQSADYLPLKEGTPLEMVQASGLVGLGGAGFPTWMKLAKPLEKGGMVIVNAAECEPILSHNIDAIEKDPASLVRGLEIAMEIAQAEKGVIAIKKKHTEAVEALEKELNRSASLSESLAGGCSLLHPNVSLHLLRDMYPMGEERAIIREVTGKLLPVTSIPLDANIIVINAETAMRMHEAVDLKKPLIDKDLTVAGKIDHNKNLIQIFHDVPIGTPVADMFEKAGGASPDAGELIMGGPFTGKRTSMDAPVVKTTGGLIAAECFPRMPEKIGLLVCACGASEERMREIAASCGAEVVDVEFCKQAIPVKNARKCENPGKCPGQVAKVLAMKKAGAQTILIGNCTDCSNTVMSCAPQMGLPVYHTTDGALRAVNGKLVRKIHGHIEDL